MKQARGFTLVELMVALLLGLILSGAVISVFIGSRNSYNKSSGVSAQSDDARFSTDFMARALRSSGFIGCNEAPRVTSMANAQPPTVVLYDFGNAVSGYEASGTGPGGAITLQNPPPYGATTPAVTGDNTVSDWTPNLPNNFTILLPDGTTPATGLQNLAIKGSDVLVVHSTLQGSGQQPPFPLTVSTIVTGPTVNNFTVTIPAGFSIGQFLSNGQIAAISDCAKATVFQITAAPTTTITHAANSSMSMGNSSDGFPINYNTGAMVFAPTTSIYYIAPGADGDSALWRGDLSQPLPSTAAAGTYGLLATELVPDVENMQVLYGVDPNNTRAATSYVTADQVTGVCPGGNFNCVVSVTVAFLVSSPPGTSTVPSVAPTYQLPASNATTSTTVTAPLDTRQRTVFQVTVALRNGLP